MFCTKCGAQNAEGVAFCTNCGSPMNEQSQQPASQEPVYQEPVYQQPVYQEPVYQQPAPQEPVYQQPVPQQPVPQQPVPGKGFGITSMVLGIVSLVLFCVFYIAIPCSIVGLVLGVVARKKATECGMKNGMATAGIACSCVALGVTVLYLLIAAIGCTSFIY